jgi:predicted Zn-dependent peptidase
VNVQRSALPGVGPDPAFTLPAFVRAGVPGGPALRIVEHREVPLVALLLVVPVAAGDDPADLPGLAALTGDLLDEGAGERRALQLHDAIQRIGGQLDVDTGYDTTVVTLVALAKHRERALRLLADVAFRPRLEDADIERVRTLRLNRLRQMRDVPAAVAEDTFVRHVFGSHPYGHLPIGRLDALGQVTADHVRAFHAERFRPERSTLIAVGDVSAREAEEDVARVFAPLAGSVGDAVGASDPRRQAVAPGGPRLVLVDRPGAPQSELRVGHLAAKRSTPDYHALITLNAVLGGQFVSRINLNLREQKGYTYGARSGFDCRRAAGTFVVQASVDTRATAESVREVLAELEGIRGNRPATPAELDLAQASLTRGYARNFETVEQLARATAQLVAYDLPDDYYARFVPSVRAVDEGALTRAARQWLRPDEATVVVVGDRAAVAAPLEQLGLAPLAIEEVRPEPGTRV